ETQVCIAILYAPAASGGVLPGPLICIIEGLATAAMAVGCCFLPLDPPSLSPSWLNPDEIRYLEVRPLASNSHSGHHKGFDKRIIFNVFLDWEGYLLIFAS
ncbi:uncharacterized protein N7500_001101, partial [Penicillium coprophilum]|uniref:uncharacterized protein n=1 Tax=Penicillium coprophilum TaxID=36646 RepID=UPI002396F037